MVVTFRPATSDTGTWQLCCAPPSSARAGTADADPAAVLGAGQAEHVPKHPSRACRPGPPPPGLPVDHQLVPTHPSLLSSSALRAAALTLFGQGVGQLAFVEETSRDRPGIRCRVSRRKSPGGLL